MSSTNKTTHYELSQYVGSDKPTYLTDYNGDMLKIDTGINAAKTIADTNATAITSLTTDVGTAQTTANTAVTNAATAQSSANTALSNVGTLANLDTATKTSTVAAINEVVGEIGNISNLTTTVKTDLVSAINEVKSEESLIDMTNFYTVPTNDISCVNDAGSNTTVDTTNSQLYVKYNNDESLVKIYGRIFLTNTGHGTVKFQTPLRPSKQVIIPMHTIRVISAADGRANLNDIDITLKTNGECSLPFTYSFATNDGTRMLLMDSVIFLKDIINHTN